MGSSSEEPDPYQQLHDMLGAARAALDNVSDGLARRQDDIGALRVAAYQKPTPPPGTPEDVLADVGEALAKVIEQPGMPPAGEDDWTYHDLAVAAVRALPVHPAGVDATTVLRVCGVIWPDRPNVHEDPAYYEVAERVIRIAREGYAPASEALRAEREREFPMCAEYRESRGVHGGMLRRTKVRIYVLSHTPGDTLVMCKNHMVEAVRKGEVVDPGPWPAVQGEMYAKVAEGEVIDRAQVAREEPAGDGPYTRLLAAQEAYRAYRMEHPEGGRCAEGRYDIRGDCDGGTVQAALAKPMNDLPAGTKVPLCLSHWQQCYRAGETERHDAYDGPVPDWYVPASDPEPEEVILREGVVVRSGDTLVLSYPAGTPYSRMDGDRRAIRGALPDSARIVVVTGVQVSAIRHPEED